MSINATIHVRIYGSASKNVFQNPVKFKIFQNVVLAKFCSEKLDSIPIYLWSLYVFVHDYPSKFPF